MSDSKKPVRGTSKPSFDIMAMPAISLEAFECGILERARRRGLVEVADQGDIDILNQATERRRTQQKLAGTSSDQKGDV